MCAEAGYMALLLRQGMDVLLVLQYGAVVNS